MIRRCEVELVLKAIRRSGVADDVEKILVPHHTGRPRDLSVAVFFVGAVLVASRGLTLTLDNIHKALTQWIAPSVQNALGTRIKAATGQQSAPITIRQVRYLLSAIEKRLEYSMGYAPNLTVVEREIRSETLHSILDKLIRASHPQTMPKNISVAWDSSGVESFGKPRWAATTTSDATDADLDEVEAAMTEVQAVMQVGKTKQGKTKHGKKEIRPVTSFDLDAHLGYRTKTHDNKSTKLFGYDLFAGVGVLPVGVDPDVMPKLLLSMTLRPAAGDTSDPTLGALDRLVDEGYQIDELLVDRGFSYKLPEDWAMELHRRGISQVQDIHPLDRGVKDYEGIRVVRGVPYCVATDDELFDNPPPPHFKVGSLKQRATNEERLNHERNTKALDEFLARNTKLQQHAFVFNQNVPTKADPFQTQWICPGKAGKVKCQLCPLSEHYPADRPVVENPGPLATAPKCCRQSTIVIPGPVLSKLRQRDPWGSPRWIDSFARRSAIEGIFGNLRSQSTQNIKRGFCRVVGLVKTSLMLAFEAVAANIRLVRKWAKRTGLTTDPLCVPFPLDHGFEELDENGQICLAEPFSFDDPPDDLAS